LIVVIIQRIFERLNFSSLNSVPEFHGWTPGLRSLLSGRVLSCGCLVGVYQTWRGREMTIIDGRGPHCECDRHQVNAIVSREDRVTLQPGSVGAPTSATG
jgi:hypothetical protein